MTAHDASVSLSVTTGMPTGYTAVSFVPDTPNPGNLSYSYKYSGGDDGNGNVTEHGRGQATISLVLSSNSNYKIETIGDGGNQTQLTYQVVDNNHATITDLNTTNEADYYNVMITDTTNGNCQFYCDPRVTNEN